jgi:hypothetical protein
MDENKQCKNMFLIFVCFKFTLLSLAMSEASSAKVPAMQKAMHKKATILMN